MTKPLTDHQRLEQLHLAFTWTTLESYPFEMTYEWTMPVGRKDFSYRVNLVSKISLSYFW
jgi:hypothetical protein